MGNDLILSEEQVISRYTASPTSRVLSPKLRPQSVPAISICLLILLLIHTSSIYLILPGHSLGSSLLKNSTQWYLTVHLRSLVAVAIEGAPSLSVRGTNHLKGNMGSAILSGLLDATRRTTDSNGSPSAKISRVIVSTKSAASAHRLGEEFQADKDRVDIRHSDNLLAMQEADIVLLACKPYLAEEVLGELGVREALAGKLVISIMAGKSPEDIEKYIYRDTPADDAESKAIIVRAMPNVAARLRQSMTIIEINNNLSHDIADTLTWIFEQIGKVKFLAADLFDIGTMLVGSSIAVLTVPLDGILDGCVAEGLRRADALEMAAQNLIGMAGLLREGVHPAILRESISAPRGCTIQGLLAVEKEGMRGACAQAMINGARHLKEIH